MTQIVDTNGGQDFSSITPAMIVDISGNYVDISTSGTFGDVDGPASSTNNAVALFNGTTGKIIKNSNITVNGNDVAFAAGDVSFSANNANFITVSGGYALVDSSTLTNLRSSSEVDITVSGVGLATFTPDTMNVNATTTNLNGTYVYLDGLLLPGAANAQIGQASPNSFKSVFAKNFGTDLVSSGVSATGTYDIDLRNGMSINYDFTSCPSGTINFTLSNPTAGSAWILTTKQNTSGTVSIAWPNSIKWQGGVSGTMTATSGTTDMFSIYCSSTSPATYLGSFSNNYF